MSFYRVFIKSIRDVLSWPVLKLVLGVGIPLFLLWIGIGFVFWEPVTALTAKIISWMPFSVVRANGAFVLAFFLWFQAVLVTFALVIAFFNAPLIQYVKKENYESVVVSLVLIISLFWTMIAFYYWGDIYAAITRLLNWLPFQTVDEGIAWFLAVYIFYNGFIVSLFLIILFYREPFLRALKERDYEDYDIKEVSLKTGFSSRAFKDLLTFIILSILLFPLFFVPVVNILIQLFLWSWLIKDSLFLSVASLYCEEEGIKELKEHKYYLWTIAIFASLLNFVPVVNILSPFFAEIMFFHLIMSYKIEKGRVRKI